MNDVELMEKTFHDSAARSYIASRLLVCSNYLAPIGLYNAHLAIECLLKSLIARSGGRLRKSHDLTVLLQDLKGVSKEGLLDDKELADILTWLNPFQELGRYGAMANATFDPDRIDNENIQVRGVITYQPSADIVRVDYAFSALLSISGQPGIINISKKDFVAASWNLPIPIDDVIGVQNDYLQ